jgi:L-alanine-DL-glutamate epimerase-like enolase superfamily enzyme
MAGTAAGFPLNSSSSALYMKITKLQVHILRAPDTGRPHWVSHFIVPKANEILVRLQTDAGIEGIGIATSYTPIEAAVQAFRSGIGELVVGEDALAPERLYQKLFARACSSRSIRAGSRSRCAGPTTAAS